MSRKEDDGRVVVAVKVRPLSEQELADGCQTCIYVTPTAPQVTAGPHCFTYDQVYGGSGSQPDDLVKDCIAPLLDGLFNGYNATVFAYGQTGSGKTYTMGSAYTPGGGAQGVIPWVIDNLFARIGSLKDNVDCTVRVSFVEIHKEEVRDLLYTGAGRARPAVTIREVLGSGVVLAGATEKEVRSEEETAAVLEQGTLCRATGATNMNNRSSRSHAVFTITLEQRRLAPTTPTQSAQQASGNAGDSTTQGTPNGGDESDDDSVIDDGDSFLCAKMHLVDLAGSERAKRTKAQGARLREGIHINRGLFALGNVISALVDGQRHVPYRDSKLTRLLQDSLGGNSRTVMLACISPADVNLDETVNTLRYADRARHIKNKPVVNRDPNAAALSHLRQQIAQLRAENNALRQALGPDANVQALLDSQLDSTSAAVIEDMQQKIINMEVDQTKLYMDLERERESRQLATESLMAVQLERDQCRLLLDQLGIGDPKAFIEQQVEGAPIPNALEELLARDNKDGSVLELMQHHYLERIAHLEQQLKTEQQLKNSLMLMRGDSGGAALDLPSLATMSMSGSMPGDPSMGDISDAMIAREQENLQALLHKEQAKRLITAQLQEQVDHVNQKIRNKDKLIKEMQEQAGGLRMKEHYDKKLKDLQTELDGVQKERTTLVQKNTELQHMTVEERRRVEAVYKERLAAMDDKIKRMKEKEAEYREMAKMKNQAEGLCNKLQNELQALKQQKVMLQRKAEEAHKDLLLWKQQHEREVQMLRKKGRRDAIELQKAEALAAKRLSILQRKSSEAEAARKRVKDLMERQTLKNREGSSTSLRDSSVSGNGAIECQPNPDAPLLRTEKARRDWLEEQLALCNQSQEYQKMMDGEIAERGEFSRQLREVQKKISILRNDAPATPIPGMAVATPERSSAVKNLIREPIDKLQQKQAELEREINTRNKNIAELQAAWSQAKSEEESKGAGAADAKRWTGLRGILECREFLRTLFRAAHDYRAQAADWQMEAVRIQEELDLLGLKYDAAREEVAAAKRRIATLMTMVGSSQSVRQPSGNADGDDTDNEVDKEAATLLLRMSELKGCTTRSARAIDASDMEDEASRDDDRPTRRSLQNILQDLPTSNAPIHTISTPVNTRQPSQPQVSSASSFCEQEEAAPSTRAYRMDIDDDLGDSDVDDSDDSDTDDPIYEPKRISRNSNRTSRTSLQQTNAVPNMTPDERKEWEQEVLNHINVRVARQGMPPAPKLTTKLLKDHLLGKVHRGKDWRPGRKTKDQLIMDYREIEGLDAPHSTVSGQSAQDLMMVDEPMLDVQPEAKRLASNTADLLTLDKHRELFKQRRSVVNMPTLEAASSASFTSGTSSPRIAAGAIVEPDSGAPPPSPAVMDWMQRKWRSQERLVSLKTNKSASGAARVE